LQLELVRKQIQDASNAKEKARLEELERQRQLELERLRKQQAAEQAAQLKRQQELEQKQREHQQAQQNLRGKCPAGFEWFKVQFFGSVHST
jgi:regulator of replication initiation timing